MVRRNARPPYGPFERDATTGRLPIRVGHESTRFHGAAAPFDFAGRTVLLPPVFCGSFAPEAARRQVVEGMVTWST